MNGSWRVISPGFGEHRRKLRLRAALRLTSQEDQPGFHAGVRSDAFGRRGAVADREPVPHLGSGARPARVRPISRVWPEAQGTRRAWSE